MSSGYYGNKNIGQRFLRNINTLYFAVHVNMFFPEFSQLN